MDHSRRRWVLPLGLIACLGVLPPARADDGPAGRPPVLVNEALAHTDPPYTDAVELYNPTEKALDLGGWWISDSLEKRERFRIPDATFIAAGGYLVFCQDAVGFPVLPCEASFFFEGNPRRPFRLGADGDDVYLFEPDPETCLASDVFHGFEFATSAGEVSFGRHLTSDGVETFPPQIETTFGGPNAGPLVGPLVFTEVGFDPDGEIAYVELSHVGKGKLHLRQSKKYPANTFRILGLEAVSGAAPGVTQVCDESEECRSFAFPLKTRLGPGEVLLLLPDSTDVGRFREDRGIGPKLEIYRFRQAPGRRPGELRLVVPETFDGKPEQFFIEIDRVDLGDPGELPADGFVIERLSPAGYSGDPISWRKGVAARGSPGRWPPG